VLVAMGVRAILEEAGYQVLLAGKVSEAIAALPDFQPQLVLCDLGLPDGDGWEVAAGLARWQADRPGNPVPFILATGWTSDPGMSEPPPEVPPACAVLHKPVDRSLLLATLAQALAQ